MNNLGFQVVTVILILYSVYHITELALGPGGPLFQSEAAFMIMEGVLPLLCCLFMALFHPGVAFGWALPSAAAYVTAKTAVVGLTRSVAVDAAQFGIRCNAVSPGFIDTDMTRAVLAKDPARRDRIESRIPTHSFGQPEDVANAIFYLASGQAAYVNGVNLPVDGGYAIGF